MQVVDGGGADPPYLHEAYVATRLRAPARPLLPLPHTLSELSGPGVRDGDVEVSTPTSPPPRRAAARAADRGQRPGRRGGRPAGTRFADRDLAGECRGPVPPRRRSARRAARSELRRRRPVPDRLRGPLPVRHDQAGRLSLAEPPECLAAGPHPFLALRPGVRSATRDADVLPRRSAVPVRPDLRLDPRPARRASG